MCPLRVPVWGDKGWGHRPGCASGDMQVRGGPAGGHRAGNGGVGAVRGEPRLRVQHGARSQPSGTFSDGLNAI